MQAETIITEEISQSLQVTAEAIAALREKNQGLTIASVDDKRGYELVHKNQMEIVRIRGEVERKRKDLKEESLNYGRMVDSEAKRITAELLEIENPLKAEKGRIDAEIQAEKDRKQAEINAKVKARQDALIAVEAIQEIHPMDLAGMAERDFQAHLSVFTEAFNARKAKADAEAAELERLRAAEAQRQAEARIEQERVAKEQAERQAALDAKGKALQDAQDKLDRERREAEEKTRKEAEAKARAEELEKARQEAAEKATRDAEAAALKREADAKAEAERLAKAEEARKERERVKAAAKAAKAPDIEKLETFSEMLGNIPVPDIRDANLGSILTEFLDNFGRFENAIKAAK